LLFDRLTIEETRGGAPDAEAAAALLAEKVLEMGLETDHAAEEVEAMLARLELRVFTAVCGLLATQI